MEPIVYKFRVLKFLWEKEKETTNENAFVFPLFSQSYYKLQKKSERNPKTQ